MKDYSLSFFLNDLDDKRYKTIATAASTPQIGIFWLHKVNNQVKIFFSLPRAIEYSERYGDFMLASEDHFNLWNSLQGRIVPKDTEYDYLPRGRIAYSMSNNQYLIQSGSWAAKAIQGIIRREFHIPVNSRLEPDIHYEDFEDWVLPPLK